MTMLIKRNKTNSLIHYILCMPIFILLFLSSCVEYETFSDTATTVYVCSGPYAERYHKSYSCSGLNGCSGDIYSTTVSSARSKGKTPCQICCK